LGQIAKGLALVLVLVGIIHLADEQDGPFGLLIPIFWIYTMIDAHRSAEEINRAAERGESLRAWGDASLGWAIALITLGVLWLMSNLGLEVFQYLRHLWPLALIALGVKFLRQGLRSRSAGPEPAPPPPPEVDSQAPAEGGTDR
jgi:cobalamin biosynthesis protein CobD/CbiB